MKHDGGGVYSDGDGELLSYIIVFRGVLGWSVLFWLQATLCFRYVITSVNCRSQQHMDGQLRLW